MRIGESAIQASLIGGMIDAVILPTQATICIFALSKNSSAMMREHSSLTWREAMLYRTVARWMLLVIAVFSAGSAAQAQTGRITGLVTDTSGGRPLEGVTITVVGDGNRTLAGARTDAAGRYTLG